MSDSPIRLIKRLPLLRKTQENTECSTQICKVFRVSRQISTNIQFVGLRILTETFGRTSWHSYLHLQSTIFSSKSYHLFYFFISHPKTPSFALISTSSSESIIYSTFKKEDLSSPSCDKETNSSVESSEELKRRLKKLVQQERFADAKALFDLILKRGQPLDEQLFSCMLKCFFIQEDYHEMITLFQEAKKTSYPYKYLRNEYDHFGS